MKGMVVFGIQYSTNKMSSARGVAYSSPEGLLTDEVDLTKQGEHTQTFFIYLIYINIYFIYLFQYKSVSGKGWGRGLA